MGLLKNIRHARHALALFERRDAFVPRRFQPTVSDSQDWSQRSYQEAWFAGTHSNVGGACPQDGLALWPLQWILSEAQKCGLGLEFDEKGFENTVDPRSLIFKNEDDKISVKYLNGISVDMWDISNVFKRDGYLLELHSGKKILLGTKSDRAIFTEDKVRGWMDESKSQAFGICTITSLTMHS